MTWTPWLVLLLVPMPALGAFAILGLGPTRIPRRRVKLLAFLGGVGPFLVMAPLAAVCLTGECHGVAPIFTLEVGASTVALAMMLDPLSAFVGTVVTAIGACVLVYSLGYMGRAPMADLRRFFALMTLFLAAMLTMVLSGDSVTFFLGWELMGLCSFFLIAFDVSSQRAAAAGRKAFIVTRVADAFLLAGLLLLFLEAGNVRLDVLIPAGAEMEQPRRALIAALLLLGALGKSAQLPFHTWLPSAMAGPTPVSALLHSATMVAAGAFLLARFDPMLETTPGVQAATAVFGAATALFGGALAVLQTDVKRLLAYSSISQIGFMVLSIGLGAPEAAAAHFAVHAIFKSLLFLSAGDIVHHSPQGTAIAAMRGALRRRPLSYLAFVAGAASLAGLPMITAGWWSKEAILASAWLAGPFGQVLWGVALLSAVLTGTYAFRPVLAGLSPVSNPRRGFGGPFIVIPLSLLAVGALTAGALVDPAIHFLGAEPPHPPAFPEAMGAAAPLLGLLAAMALTWLPGPAIRLERARRLRRGAGMDTLYEGLFVRPFVHLVERLNGRRGRAVEDPLASAPVIAVRRAGAAATDRLGGGESGPMEDPVGALLVRAVQRAHAASVDRLLADPIDAAWTRVSAAVRRLQRLARRTQTGRSRDYALALGLGVAALALLAWGTTWR